MTRSKIFLCMGMTVIFSMIGITHAFGWSLQEAAAPYKGTVLHVLINHHTMYDYSKPYIPEFEKITGIKVDVELLTRKTMNTKQQFELASNTAAS